jgi:hypothetical protein
MHSGKAIGIKHPLVSKHSEFFHVILLFLAHIIHFEKKQTKVGL